MQGPHPWGALVPLCPINGRPFVETQAHESNLWTSGSFQLGHLGCPPPAQESDSALIEAYLAKGQLSSATGFYRELRAAGRWPAHWALNALLQAHATAYRLGDVVTLVCDVVSWAAA